MNFIFGLVAVSKSLLLQIMELGQYQIVWGFFLGFFVATLLYVFIITENPRHVPMILFGEKQASFEKIHGTHHPEGEKHYLNHFTRQIGRFKFVFFLNIFLLLLVILYLVFFRA